MFSSSSHRLTRPGPPKIWRGSKHRQRHPTLPHTKLFTGHHPSFTPPCPPSPRAQSRHLSIQKVFPHPVSPLPPPKTSLPRALTLPRTTTDHRRRAHAAALPRHQPSRRTRPIRRPRRPHARREKDVCLQPAALARRAAAHPAHQQDRARVLEGRRQRGSADPASARRLYLGRRQSRARRGQLRP